MKLIIKEKFEINLPDMAELDTEGTGKTHDTNTSYLSAFKQRVASKGKLNAGYLLRAGALNLLNPYLNGVGSYFEPMGGVGVTACNLAGDAPKVMLNELDHACAETIRQNFPAWEVTEHDMFAMDFPEADLMFLDYNNFTLKKFNEDYRQVTDQAFSKANKYIIINDCSNFYLNRGQKSLDVYSKLMGTQLNSLSDYYQALQGYYAEIYPEWRLIASARFYESSYIMFVKQTDVDPVVAQHTITSKEAASSPVIVLEKDKPANRLW